MINRNFALAVGTLALLITGCAEKKAVEQAAPKPSAQQDIMALRSSLIDGYANAYNGKDAAGVASLFAADAIRMSPDKPVTVGREAIQSEYQAAFAEIEKLYSQITFAETSNDAAVSGDWAYMSGAWTWSGNPKAGGKPVDLKGKWLMVAQRQPDGAWKITRSCWNSDAPMPVPAR